MTANLIDQQKFCTYHIIKLPLVTLYLPHQVYWIIDEERINDYEKMVYSIGTIKWISSK